MKICPTASRLVPAITFLLFSASSTASSPSNVIQVYGAKQGTELNTKADADYVIHLGSFSSESNAKALQHKIEKTVNAPVQLIFKEGRSAPYQVVVGPIHGRKNMQHVSRDILGLSHTVKHTVAEPKMAYDLSLDSFKEIKSTADTFMSEKRQKVITISAGPAWSNTPATQQNIYPSVDIVNTYVSGNTTSTLINGEIFAGLQSKLVHPNLVGRLGLALAGSSGAEVEGQVWQAGSATFNNLSYTYQITHAHIAAAGKLLWLLDTNTEEKYYPYISGSLGLGYNYASQFLLSTRDSSAVPTPLFQSNTVTSFTYTVGAGFEREINETMHAGVGYRFADWGKSALGAAPGQAFGGGLVLKHLYTNQLQVSFTCKSDS